MIDDQLRLAPQVLDDAADGDETALREALPDDADPTVVEALLAAVAAPVALVEVVMADAQRGLLRQRARFGPDLALISADGDDRTSEQQVLLARPSVELVHLLAAGNGFGLRPAGEDDPIVLDAVEDAAGFALGQGELPVPAPPEQEQRPVRWWALRWKLPDPNGGGASGGVAVLDAARLWRQHETRLEPTTALEVWLELTPLIDAIGRAAGDTGEAEPAATPGQG